MGWRLQRALNAWDLTGGLAASHADAHFALREIFGGDGELHRAGFAGTQMDPLESAQVPDGIVRRRAPAQVQLHHLVALARGNVLHAHRYHPAFHGPARTQPGVLKRRVTQAETETEERLALEVAIRPALHRVIVERGQLLHAAIERHRETARGIVYPGERLGDGRSNLFAAVPRFQYGHGMFGGEVRGQRAAAGQHDNHRLARGDGRLDQLLLRLR